jgi:LuxR family maltose regulon positive regulatory protein
MAGLLVATKLHAPTLRLGIVARPGLVARLQRRAGIKLTLVSAPAGFGKTTLLAAYLDVGDGDPATAWLSLDPADNEPVTFWSHVIAALQTVIPGVGAGLLAAIQAGEVPGEPLIATLINELHAEPDRVDLVLDDYYLVERTEIHDGMGYLLEHLPQNLRVVIGTRSDPPLLLARLRARGELAEIRATDLRFTAEDAKAYFNGAMGLELSGSEIATLTHRTEGWIAALQLAALSMAGHQDAAGFISSFAGNDRYVVDYLVEEVLQRLPEAVRRFLMRTCILERLSGSLCDAVTGESSGAAMLETLDRSNLFVVPLDSRREWYRYHHLFADVLQAHFAKELGDERAVLHRCASDWFAAQDSAPEAIRHAFAASDTERAAALIEHAIPVLSRNRQEPTLRAWIQALPDELVRCRPVLGIGLVGCLVSIGAFDGIEGRLRDAEKAIAAIDAGDMTAFADRGQLPSLTGDIEMYRAALAQVRGDMPAVIAHAQRSIERAPPDHFGRAGSHGFLGIAHWTRGDLVAADRAWRESRDGLRRAGRLADVLGTSIAIADINVTLGRLRSAARVWDEALQLSAEQRHVLRGTADVHAGFAELHLVSGDLNGAGEHLVRSEELGETAGLPQFPHRWRMAMAKLRLAAGDPEGALDLADEAERVYVPDFFPNVRPIAAMKARIFIGQGRLAEAERWHRKAGVAVTDELTYLREFEHITLSRLMIAQGKGEATLALLDRLLQAAEAGGRFGSVIEISVLQALVRHAQRDDSAVAVLDKALTLAAPEGYVRVFVDEGTTMESLLRAAAKRGNGFARTLLAEFAEPGGLTAEPHDRLIETLSERELDVLRLLRSDLDGPDIARELRVSLNTMRTHTKNIYEKLGANSRRGAVRRAEELGLFQRR